MGVGGTGVGVGVDGTGVGVGGTGVAVGVGGIGVGVADGGMSVGVDVGGIGVAAGAASCEPHPTKRSVTVTRPITVCRSFRRFIALFLLLTFSYAISDVVQEPCQLLMIRDLST